MSRLDRHDDLFERGVAGTLADAVDRALDLPRAGLDTRQTIRHRHAQIIMTVRADDRLADVPYSLLERANDAGVLRGRGVANRVGNVDRRRAGLDGRLDHLTQEVQLGPRCVFRRKLDVRAIALGPFHAIYGSLDDLLGGHPQLVLAVDGRC